MNVIRPRRRQPTIASSSLGIDAAIGGSSRATLAVPSLSKGTLRAGSRPLPVSNSAPAPAPPSPPIMDTPAVTETAQTEWVPVNIPAMVRMLGGTIAWLSGSVVGIGAIFYALGYLVTLANLNMLGLDPLAFRYDSAFYVQRGSGFLVVVAIDLAQSLWYFWPLALGFALACVGCGFVGKRCRALATTRPYRVLSEHPGTWKIPLYLLLVGLLYQQMRAHFWFPEQMTISGVLYSDGTSGESPLRQWIASGNLEDLRDLFSSIVYQQVTIGILLLFAWALNRGRPFALLMTAPFAAVFAISIAWLPFEYGKLVLPNKFPEVIVRLEHPLDAGVARPRPMYLLNKTDSEFVLWDPQRRSVEWFPDRTLTSMEIQESRSLSELIKPPARAAR